nr:hypothetical protein [Candidatus Gracilibacteria bacterium]
MTPTATQDEDLIILSDTVTPTFDDAPIISEDLNREKSPVISFDGDNLSSNNETSDNETSQVLPLTETSTQSIESNKTVESNELNLDSSVNYLFGDSSKEQDETPNIPADQIEESKVEISDINQSNISADDLFGNLDFSDNSLNVKEDTVNEELEKKENIVDLGESVDQGVLLDQPKEIADEVLPNEIEINTNELIDNENTNELVNDDKNTGDMNFILDSTISKLQKRQTGIGDNKSQKISMINELDDKVKELKEKISILKKEVESLDTENSKIEENVSILESMKLGKVLDSIPKTTRAHNTKKLIVNA